MSDCIPLQEDHRAKTPEIRHDRCALGKYFCNDLEYKILKVCRNKPDNNLSKHPIGQRGILDQCGKNQHKGNKRHDQKVCRLCSVSTDMVIFGPVHKAQDQLYRAFGFLLFHISSPGISKFVY